MIETKTAEAGQTGRCERDPVPVVSIGLPVFNGEKYLREALDSLLAQTFRDFELMISDNASTDATQAICEEYAAQDKRISYVRQPNWLSAYDNFYYCLERARGKFFMWSAVDDHHPPNYVEVLAGCLNSNPQAVLAFGKVSIVKHNCTLADAADIPFAFATAGRRAWIALTITSQINCYHIYGLWRPEALRSIPYGLYGRCTWGADLAMLMSASVLGEFLSCPETAFVYRETKKTSKERVKYQDGREKPRRVHAMLNLLRATFLSVGKTGGALMGGYAVVLTLIKHVRLLPGFIRNRMDELVTLRSSRQ